MLCHTPKTTKYTRYSSTHSPSLFLLVVLLLSACIRVFNTSNGYNAEAENIPPIIADTTSDATDSDMTYNIILIYLLVFYQ